MKDLEKFINRRKRCDAEFADGFEAGYSNFKVGVLFKQAREGTGMTQDEMERKSKRRNQPCPGIENHAEDARLSTIQRYGKALGKRVRVDIVG